MKQKTQKKNMLNKNFQFQQVYRKGQSYVAPTVVTYILSKPRGQVRYGITASKKIGGAVDRNRARRVIRAALSELLPDIDGAYDLVFVARKATITTKSHHLYSVLHSQFTKAGIIR
ncbi:MAG: ribonuclease P protein component [Oscillospiraceae bacterium]|nr:ribonuclease P protein component [Oscillospiraceae bacterium]